MGAAGRGRHRCRAPALRSGPESRLRDAPAGAHRPLRLPFHPHGGGQHSGLPALRRLLLIPAPAILGSVATLPKNGQTRPLSGRVRFACWDSPKPLCRTEVIHGEQC